MVRIDGLAVFNANLSVIMWSASTVFVKTSAMAVANASGGFACWVAYLWDHSICSWSTSASLAAIS